jgi:hypothetical protein
MVSLPSTCGPGTRLRGISFGEKWLAKTSMQSCTYELPGSRVSRHQNYCLTLKSPYRQLQQVEQFPRLNRRREAHGAGPIGIGERADVVWWRGPMMKRPPFRGPVIARQG